MRYRGEADFYQAMQEEMGPIEKVKERKDTPSIALFHRIYQSGRKHYGKKL